MNQTLLRKAIYLTAACGLGMSLVGCGSNWRTHDAKVMGDAKPSTRNAPDWVQGSMPMSGDVVYFVGRSYTPDYHRDSYRDGGNHHHRTPNIRVGFTVMDEREAVQSARNDVFDQIRQRLAPRNVGTTGQYATMTIDNGACLGCGDPLPMNVRTNVMPACNAPCLYEAGDGHPAGAHVDRCSPCGSKAMASGQPTTIAADCYGCKQPHAFTVSRKANCGDCPTVVHSVNAMHRASEYVTGGPYMGRDLNVMNVGIDSVMPAMLAHLNEEEIYFEKWHVHETGDSGGRPFAEGRDEWQSYKCWILCSIPRAEYDQIAAEFRGRYDELYEMTLEWTVEDRDRRVNWETESRMLDLKRQDEERSWNREDEIISRDHAVTLDKDRHPLPGRRFTVVGGQ